MEQQSSPRSAIPEKHSESTAPTPVRPALPIVALSEDALLLEAITNAAAEWCPVINAPSADRFIDQLVASGAELALIDAGAAPSAFAEFLDTLHRQFPQLQLLVAGPGTMQHQIAAQVTDGTVFRFAHKPASAQRLKLFVDAALRQRQARITEEILGSPASSSRAGAEIGLRMEGLGGEGGRPWLLSASIAGALVIGVAIALIWYSSHSTAPATAASTAAEPGGSAVAQSIPERIPERAAPPAAAPPSAPSPATTVAAQRAAEQDAIDRAAAERSERSERERLAAESQSRAAAIDAEQARRAADARSAQVRQYVELAAQRITGGALVEPAEDSASKYVTAAIALAPDDLNVRAVSLTLGEALIGSFRKALNAGDRAAAARWIQACKDYQISEATVNQMSVQLDAYESAQLAQSTGNRVAAGISSEPAAAAPLTPTVPAPAPVVATAPPATAAPSKAAVSNSKAVAAISGVMAEGELHRSHFVPPVYPVDALRLGQTGTVEMDFTVTVDGKVRDIKVTGANPTGIFERASTYALSRSQYEPVERNGERVEQRAHIRMRFAL